MNGPEFLVPIAFFASVVIVVVNVLRYRQRRLELGAGGMGALGHARALDERLERMEQAIDAMAVEMERLAESQRFTTHLLSQGMAAGLAPARAESHGLPSRSAAHE